MGERTQIDIWRRFRPTPSQLKFLRSTAHGRLFSSGYGSGKSSTGSRESIRWAVQYAGSRNLIARLTATDLRDTTMVTFWKEMATIGFRRGTHYEYNRADKILDWWNGSVTIFRHLDDEEGLGSLELSSAFVDEGSEVGDNIYMTLSSSRLRWHLPVCDQQDRVAALIARDATDEEIRDVPCHCPRGIWVCTNPGASGYLRAVTRGQVDGWEWIRAKPGDNPYNGPEYYAKMERDRRINGEIWMKRYYEGDWTAFHGQRFTMFDRDRHIMPTTFRPDPTYEVIEGIDFGHRETFVSWIAYRPDSPEPVVVFDELQVQEVEEPGVVARRIHEIRAKYGIAGRVRAFGDPAGVGATQFSSVSPIQAYAKEGIYIAPCKTGKNPQARADLLAAFLTENRVQLDRQIWPGIVFGPNCTATVDSIVNMRWKPQTSKLGEDPREQFLKKDDHGFDACTYGLVGVPPPNITVSKPKPLAGVNLSAREAWRSKSDPEVWEDLG